MKTDCNPSIVGALFCTPDVYDKWVKAVNGKFGMAVREIRFVDVGIPLNEDYDKAINYLKSFSMPMMKRFIEADFPFKSMILKQIEKKGLKIIDLSSWKCDNRHELLLSGFTPIAVDIKYSKTFNKNSDQYNEKEEENLKKLIKFESEGYKPKITGVFDD